MDLTAWHEAGEPVLQLAVPRRCVTGGVLRAAAFREARIPDRCFFTGCASDKVGPQRGVLQIRSVESCSVQRSNAKRQPWFLQESARLAR